MGQPNAEENNYNYALLSSTTEPIHHFEGRNERDSGATKGAGLRQHSKWGDLIDLHHEHSDKKHDHSDDKRNDKNRNKKTKKRRAATNEHRFGGADDFEGVEVEHRSADDILEGNLLYDEETNKHDEKAFFSEEKTP